MIFEMLMKIKRSFAWKLLSVKWIHILHRPPKPPSGGEGGLLNDSLNPSAVALLPTLKLWQPKNEGGLLNDSLNPSAVALLPLLSSGSRRAKADR
jgi:hypothetical protein